MGIKISVILTEKSKEYNGLLIIFHLCKYIPLLFIRQGHFVSIKGEKYKNKQASRKTK